MVETKFCGMTRAEDVALAVALGAAFVGVVFAPSPRRLSPESAREVLAPTVGTATRRVGVFGPATWPEIAAAARTAQLDVVQLHAMRDAEDIRQVRTVFDGEVWGVARIGPDGLREEHRAMFDVGDGVVMDALSARGLGGTGESFDWAGVALAVAQWRGGPRVIIAGGLHAGNVAAAIDVLAPDVVDVSSGVERAPGIKDPDRMRAFAEAVRRRAPR